MTGFGAPAENWRNGRNLDLEVDAASERRFERSGQPLPLALGLLLEHDLCSVAIEIGKTFPWTIINNFEAEQNLRYLMAVLGTPGSSCDPQASFAELAEHFHAYPQL